MDVVIICPAPDHSKVVLELQKLFALARDALLS